MTARGRDRGGIILSATALAGLLAAGLGVALISILITVVQPPAGSGCGGAPPAAASIILGPPGSGRLVGATEYGGPGDPSSGSVGARGDNLLVDPDTYAELGGLTWQTATAMGGLQYMTPLRITWGGHSGIAYKRDFGLGGGPVSGLPRAIDLWWQFAVGLGIPYENGLWSGPVRVARAPLAGAGNLLGSVQLTASTAATVASSAAVVASDPVACAPGTPTGVPLAPGERAQLESDGLAAAPRNAPLAVKQIIAAGNEIAGRPYVYGAGHGLPLSSVGSAYDCSSSVEHLLYGAGLLPVTYAAASSELERFGLPGPGRWVTLYANPSHVFMYVAGLRWDTHDAAGAGDGSAGIGWHPLIRSAAGFVARHPVGL